jgi:hypothetical protein
VVTDVLAHNGCYVVTLATGATIIKQTQRGVLFALRSAVRRA